MSKLSELMESFGSGDISLSETVNTLSRHEWTKFPPTVQPDSAENSGIIEGSWQEIEQAFNLNILSFKQFMDLSHAIDQKDMYKK